MTSGDSMTWHYLIVAFIALQRLAEVAYSRRNIKRLLGDGATLVEEPIYPWLVAVHGGWIAALAVAVPADTPADPVFLGLYLLLLGLRVWVMAALGRFWCTRIVTLPGAPLVRRGPYRFLRHPNYVVVVGEILVAPLIFGAWGVALAFSALNGVLLWIRMQAEETVLAERRNIETPCQ